MKGPRVPEQGTKHNMELLIMQKSDNFSPKDKTTSGIKATSVQLGHVIQH